MTEEQLDDDLRIRLRRLAADISVGWDEYTDAERTAYGRAFKEAARRILQEVDGAP